MTELDPREAYDRGYRYGEHFDSRADLNTDAAAVSSENRLEEYFDRHTTGPGIWKFRHYFEIYERHFEKLVGSEVHVVEIGVYSGGSLDMWKDYFGPACHVYGVDIRPECHAYERDGVRIFIGDQGDPSFWGDFAAQVPTVDVVIDDGSHSPEDQIVTLEALLPHIRPGGVYLCEDVLHEGNAFHDYVNGLSRNLYRLDPRVPGRAREPSKFQRTVRSIHLYPYVTVIEKRAAPLESLRAPKQGTQWQPFFGRSPAPEGPVS